jgi:hypothetical protein
MNELRGLKLGYLVLEFGPYIDSPSSGAIYLPFIARFEQIQP